MKNYFQMNLIILNLKKFSLHLTTNSLDLETVIKNKNSFHQIMKTKRFLLQKMLGQTNFNNKMNNKTKIRNQLKRKNHMQLKLKTLLTKIVKQYFKNKKTTKAKKVINKKFLTSVKQKCNFSRNELVKF